MSTVIEHLEKDVCSAVFIDILLLLWVFIKMDLRCGVLRGPCRLVRDIYDLVTKKFTATGNLTISRALQTHTMSRGHNPPKEACVTGERRGLSSISFGATSWI